MTEAMTELAQRRVHSLGAHEDTRPNYKLLVGSQDLSDVVESISVSYQAGEDSSDGTSEADINVFTSLQDKINATVRVFAGYGSNLAEIFTGKLSEVEDDHYGEASTGACFGPFKLLTSQQFLEEVSYTGSYIERALYDIHSRASIPRGSIEVVAGRSFQIGADEEATFKPEVPFADAAKSLCESAGFVGYDLPGSRRKYQPRPRSSPGAKGKAVYNESHYPPGGFIAKRNPQKTYARVLVFRREEEGTDAFPPVMRSVEVETRYKPAPNSAYILPEFLGDYSDAQNEAARLARMLAAGEYEISLEGIAANADLMLFDTLDTETTEIRDDGDSKERYRVLYRWTIDELSIEIDEGITQSLSGTGIKVSETKIPAPFLPPAPRGYALPTHRSPTPEYGYDSRGFFVAEPVTDEPWFGWDESGFWIIPEYSEGRTDVDEAGWYLTGVRRSGGDSYGETPDVEITWNTTSTWNELAEYDWEGDLIG